jgi:hypothetical protein
MARRVPQALRPRQFQRNTRLVEKALYQPTSSSTRYDRQPDRPSEINQMIACLAVGLCFAGAQLRSVVLPNPPAEGDGLLISDDGRYLFDYDRGVERISLATGLKESAGPISVIISAATPARVLSRTISQSHSHPITLARSQFLGGYTTGMVQFWADAPSGNRLLVLTRPAGVEYLWAVTDVHFDERTENPNRSWLLKVPRGCWPQSAYLSERSKTVEVWVAEPEGLTLYSADQRQPGSYLKRRSATPFRDSRLGIGSMLNTFDPATKTLVLHESNQVFLLVNGKGRLLRRHSAKSGDSIAQGIWQVSVSDRSVPGGKSKWNPVAYSANRRFWLVRNRSTGDLKLMRL